MSAARAAMARGGVRAATLAVACVVAVASRARAGAGPWSPEVNYALNCQGCHLASGAETRGLVPPLAGTVGHFAAVPEGRAYLVRLPNVASTTLTDTETADLLNWLVRRFSSAEEARTVAPFTAGEVARGRHDPLVDVEAARAVVLEALTREAARSSFSPGTAAGR